MKGGAKTVKEIQKSSPRNPKQFTENEVYLTGVIIGSRLGDLLGHEGRGLKAKEALNLIRVPPQQTQRSFSFKANRVTKYHV